jgi:hypothetical protein
VTGRFRRDRALGRSPGIEDVAQDIGIGVRPQGRGLGRASLIPGEIERSRNDWQVVVPGCRRDGGCRGHDPHPGGTTRNVGTEHDEPHDERSHQERYGKHHQDQGHHVRRIHHRPSTRGNHQLLVHACVTEAMVWCRTPQANPRRVSTARGYAMHLLLQSVRTPGRPPAPADHWHEAPWARPEPGR